MTHLSPTIYFVVPPPPPPPSQQILHVEFKNEVHIWKCCNPPLPPPQKKTAKGAKRGTFCGFSDFVDLEQSDHWILKLEISCQPCMFNLAADYISVALNGKLWDCQSHFVVKIQICSSFTIAVQPPGPPQCPTHFFQLLTKKNWIEHVIIWESLQLTVMLL